MSEKRSGGNPKRISGPKHRQPHRKLLLIWFEEIDTKGVRIARGYTQRALPKGYASLRFAGFGEPQRPARAAPASIFKVLSACFHTWNGFCFKVGVDMKIANLSDSTGSPGLEAGQARVLDNICQPSSNSSLQTGQPS
ncbi:hypothetical protein PCANC_27582 [Puccinia coronata f. sp. avenae]|uniref:Uncharacterized protein n=1 Tax=Puccinia coronata f. sp. avenae TaxID=200324 RepID=A0A2N5TLQ1_9BASI|nr:hypothetical protein PCANC_27582 [Puccinia coronata f. sp. avenae]